MIIDFILRELGNIVDGLLFTYDLSIYTTKRSVRLTSKMFSWNKQAKLKCRIQKGLLFSSTKTVVIVFRNRRKRNVKPLELMLRNQIYHTERILTFCILP